MHSLLRPRGNLAKDHMDSQPLEKDPLELHSFLKGVPAHNKVPPIKCHIKVEVRQIVLAASAIGLLYILTSYIFFLHISDLFVCARPDDPNFEWIIEDLGFVIGEF